jgi:predicted MFS family arabinose efflux permease
LSEAIVPAADRTEASSSAGVIWPAFVLFAINVLNFYDRHVPGALVEPIRREFHLTDAQNGLLGSAFIWVYALVGIPFGRLADTGSRKKLLAGAVAVWASLTALAGLAPSFGVLLVSRLGVGVGEAGCAPTATSWLGDLFPPARRARALALFMLAVPVGGALGFLLSGRVAEAYGWRTAMVLAAAPAIVLLPALLLLREPPRGATEAAATAVMAGGVARLLRIPTLWWIVASGALLNFNMYVLATFLPALFARVHGLSLAASNAAAAFVYVVGGVGGALVSAWVGDKVVGGRPDGRLGGAAALTMLSAPLAYVAFARAAGSASAAAGFLALAYAALTAYYGLVYSAIQDIVAPAERGTAMAFYFLGMYLAGGSYGPLVAGYLSDRIAARAALTAGSPVVTDGFRAVGLQQALLVVPIFSVLLALVLYGGSRAARSRSDGGSALVV